MIAILDAGADDYLAQPFSVPELAARLRSILRRVRTPSTASVAPRKDGNLVLDRTRYQVELSGREIILTPVEFRTLHTLMEEPGRLMNHEVLLAAIWGEKRVQQANLRVMINRLRRKLGDDPSAPAYRLRTQPSATASEDDEYLTVLASLSTETTETIRGSHREPRPLHKVPQRPRRTSPGATFDLCEIQALGTTPVPFLTTRFRILSNNLAWPFSLPVLSWQASLLFGLPCDERAGIMKEVCFDTRWLLGPSSHSLKRGRSSQFPER